MRPDLKEHLLVRFEPEPLRFGRPESSAELEHESRPADGHLTAEYHVAGISHEKAPAGGFPGEQAFEDDLVGEIAQAPDRIVAVVVAIAAVVAFVQRSKADQGGGKSGWPIVLAVIAGLVALGGLCAGAAHVLFTAPRKVARREAQKKDAVLQPTRTVPRDVDPAPKPSGGPSTAAKRDGGE